jgi:hypothetical protein
VSGRSACSLPSHKDKRTETILPGVGWLRAEDSFALEAADVGRRRWSFVLRSWLMSGESYAHPSLERLRG